MFLAPVCWICAWIKDLQMKRGWKVGYPEWPGSGAMFFVFENSVVSVVLSSQPLEKVLEKTMYSEKPTSVLSSWVVPCMISVPVL